MRSILFKSIQLKRFHMMLVIIIISLLIWIWFRYASMIAASVERYTFISSVETIRKSLHMAAWLDADATTDCSIFDSKPLFKRYLSPDKWHYNSSTHTLTYRVNTTRYFRSKLGQVIDVTFLCRRNRVELSISDHQWCRRMGVWACQSW